MSSLSPYITPVTLQSAATGISWNTLGGKIGDTQSSLAEQVAICWRVTSEIDLFCNQTLRATIDQETLNGPNDRLTVASNGIARFQTMRWPVISVTAGTVYNAASSTDPGTVIPANSLRPQYVGPGMTGTAAASGAGVGSAGIEILPGYVTWAFGRNGCRVQVTYVNGWPHAGITANVAAGATTLTVDDCTGWAAGTRGVIHDGEDTEVVEVSAASATSGPGTLTIGATAFAHTSASITTSPIVITTLPSAIQQAAIFLASAQALTRGASATTIPRQPGISQSSGGGIKDLKESAHELLKPFRRVI